MFQNRSQTVDHSRKGGSGERTIHCYAAAKFAVELVPVLRTLFYGLLVFLCSSAVACAEQAVATCGAPPVVTRQAKPNFFSEEQEQWLGEAMADSLEAEIRPVRDASLSAHLQAIADRLMAVLPPTSIRYRVLLIESSEVNGLSIAGGHIYITRKLAAVAKDDDELAGVIGHEIGHIASHQFAFDTTRDLQRLLGVTAVGDRADVFAKYHALMDARLQDKHPAPIDTDQQQNEADRIGVYAEAAAGYRPAAAPEFWDRVFFVGGRTGGRLTDFFSITKPSEKRLRLLRAMAAAVPTGCGGGRPGDERAFAAWHQAVIADQKGSGEDQAAALKTVRLTPPLRMELDQLRFSPDGRSILAQDESSIFVLSRSPFGLQFRIDASNAKPAHFSPDSQSITFSRADLHTEQWSVQSGKLLAAHELLWRDPCYETRLAPDGRSLLCVGMKAEDLELSLTLLDTETSQPLWQNKNWAMASWPLALGFVASYDTGQGADRMPSAFSADNNVLLFGSGAMKVAFDLRSRMPLKLGDAAQFYPGADYAFIGNRKLAMMNDGDPKHSLLFSFPEGKEVARLGIPPRPITAVTNAGENLRVLLFGEKDFDAGLADLSSTKLVTALKVHALDEYGEDLIAEADSGGVGLLHLGATSSSKPQVVPLPFSPLSSLSAVAISPDGRYLAASGRYRGGLWDLETGHQIAALYGFTDATWTEDDAVYLQTRDQFGSDRHMAQISTRTKSGKVLPYKLDADTRMRYGRLTEWKENARKKTWQLTLHDPADNRVLWSREFPDAHLGFSASYGDRDLLFSFSPKSNTAREAMKSSPQLASQATAVRNRDRERLLQVIDAKTGALDGSLVLEMPANFAGLDGVNRAGDLLYVTTADERTAVYSMATGKEMRKMFGTVMALDAGSGRVCTANRVGEAVAFDAEGNELLHLRLGEPIRFATLQQKGDVLTVLTADQQVRSFAVTGTAPARLTAAMP